MSKCQMAHIEEKIKRRFTKGKFCTFPTSRLLESNGKRFGNKLPILMMVQGNRKKEKNILYNYNKIMAHFVVLQSPVAN